MRVLVAGASGFIGTALAARLRADGHDVVRLVRRRAESAEEASWSPASGIIDFTVMERVDAVVNLSGASLARLPWTARYRQEILDSRISATRTIVDAMRKARRPPGILLNASAVGVYGDRPGLTLTEETTPGAGFLADVVARWEAQARLSPAETRTVVFRSGIVVGDGGAMKRIRLLTSVGLAGRLGTGGQHWPWIALEDEVGAIAHLLESDLHGPVNLAGPTPATAEQVMGTLARLTHRPFGVNVPERLLETALGTAADELLLASQRVRPDRLLADGFAFEHPTVEDALRAMLADRRVRA
ncbi:TIGR01777 family oxidoreductase [Agromyces sp. MMS24-JH15]|uniref:TIGR01777 family oxidoreductase n=1 Tax=Agromyces sp. MMS24-JH15 TaxID=3243765 RepID=UPI00374A7480